MLVDYNIHLNSKRNADMPRQTKNFLFSTPVHTDPITGTLDPTQSSVQWAPGLFPRCKVAWVGVKLGR